MADYALSDIKATIEFSTAQGIYREECAFPGKRYNCICNLWVSDESCMSDRIVTDIMGFIISKNILHATITTAEKEFSFRVEIVITDGNNEPVSCSDISEKLFDEILYRAVSSVGQKNFSVYDYCVKREFYLDDVKFESPDEICSCLEDEKAAEFLDTVKGKKEILRKGFL